MWPHGGGAQKRPCPSCSARADHAGWTSGEIWKEKERKNKHDTVCVVCVCVCGVCVCGVCGVCLCVCVCVLSVWCVVCVVSEVCVASSAPALEVRR